MSLVNQLLRASLNPFVQLIKENNKQTEPRQKKCPKDDEDIETMFSRIQTLIFGLQVLNKSHTKPHHDKKILKSFLVRWRPKVIVIPNAKDLNKLSLKILVSN